MTVMAYINKNTLQVNNKREIRGWAMYDWANSAFSTTVVTVFFGPFLTAIAKDSADALGFLYLGNIPIRFDSFFTFVVSASVLLQVTILPILGALADYAHLRKRLLMLFSTIGAFTTMSMFFITTGMHWIAGILFIVANVSFGAAFVFYNAFLPDIASEETRDKVSAYGWAMGYLGGGILLLINLIMFAFSETLGTGLVVRLSLLSAGVWWFGFSLITFKTLKSRLKENIEKREHSYFTAGFYQLAKLLDVSARTVFLLTFSPLIIPVLFLISTFVFEIPIIILLSPAIGPLLIVVRFAWVKFGSIPETIKFLIAYLLYNDGIQTVIVVAAVFATLEVGIGNTTLIILILFIQFAAFFGALLFGRLAGKIGAKRAIILSLIIWSFITIYAYIGLMNSSPSPFGIPWNQVELFILGFLIAIVLGGSQALSRSLFSVMIPKNQEAEFFSFYEVSERGTSWIGPFLFGAANQVFGSLRMGILSLIVFFLLGLLILPFVKVKKGINDAKAV
jgi:UMF1 family MFS transporter